MSGSKRRHLGLLLVAALASVVCLCLLGHLNWLFNSDRAAGQPLAEWERLPDGPESPDDGCRLRSERARYAVDRAAQPECRRRLLRVACAFESGRLPYRLRHVGQACPARLLSGSGPATSCHSLLQSDSCPYPREVIPSASWTNNMPAESRRGECLARCRSAGYRLASISNRDCVCLQLLGNGCSRPAIGYNCTGASIRDGYYLVSQTGLNASSLFVSHTAPAYGPEFESYSWENDRVRLVYLMTLSGRGVRQVMRLLSAVYYVNHYYYIHVDSRDDFLYESLMPLVARFPNVRLMRRRFPTIWGGTGLLDLMLAAFRDLLNCTDWHWDFVINLSESDFPIRPDRQLTAYLTEMRHLSFLASHSGNYSDFMRKQAIERYFVQCDNHMYFLGSRQPIEGLLFDGGSDWLTLNREFVQFVISGLDNNHTIVTNIVEYFKYGLLPVESVFHTIAQNTELCGRVANANLRLVNWDRKRGCRCQHLPVADWCGCSPMVYRGAEAAAYASSSGSGGHGAFFARKFDPTISVSAVDAAYAELMKQRHGGAAGREMRAKLGRPRYWLSAFTAGAPGLTPVQSAFGRLLTRLLCAELLSGTCPAGFDPDSVRAVEVTEFYLEDAFQGPLLTASIGGGVGGGGGTNAAMLLDAHFSLQSGIGSGQAVRIVHPKQQPHGNASSSTSAYQSVIAARFMEFEVGRQYDWKEDLFRDRLSLLAAGRAADSGLQLRYAWGPGPAVTATFLLLDPDGAIRSAFQLSVPELLLAEDSTAKEVGCTDLQAPGSLEPGVWRLLLLDEQQPLSVGSAVAESEFILLPTGSDAHSNQLVKPDPNSPQYLALFKAVPAASIAQLRLANRNPAESAAANPDIRLAVRLLSRRYRLETVCRHSDSSDSAAASSAACPGIVGLTDSCSGSDWSTRYADLRYRLGGLDPLTGHLRN
ncbi:hypothetical protein BOX15_Mlig011848g2 [Macrostomum lignano]|uniref:protein xylosyltransferase n=1 Tax=Macrostomum lignano TaxID=282301 RepID=A0A267FKH0_9PLAT|nr:hypothetical protein BOX15_Mlig011848g2 [Macrostomum lignano]